MNTIQPSVISSAIGIILLVFLVAFASAWMVEFLQPKARVTCASFGSYDYPSVLAAYNAGDKFLDANKDGIPCNSIYTNWKKIHGYN